MTILDRLILLSQEQDAQRESLGELRLALDAMRRQLERAENRIATLEAAHVASVMRGSVQGLEGEWMVTGPLPDWGPVPGGEGPPVRGAKFERTNK